MNGGPSGTGYTDNQKPNMVSGVDCRANDSNNPEQIINPDAVTLTGFALGSIGNEQRGACRGPGFFETDLSFYKTMRTGTHAQVQLRFEIFNLFNNTNFLSQNLINTMNLQTVTLDPTGRTITGYTTSGNFGRGDSHPRSAPDAVRVEDSVLVRPRGRAIRARPRRSFPAGFRHAHSSSRRGRRVAGRCPQASQVAGGSSGQRRVSPGAIPAAAGALASRRAPHRSAPCVR